MNLRIGLFLNQWLNGLLQMIPRNVDSTVFLFDECYITIIKRAFNLYNWLLRVIQFYVIIKSIFLIKFLITALTFIGRLSLMLLHMIMHSILLLLYLGTNSANIESLLICFIFIYHLLALQTWYAGFNFYRIFYLRCVYLNNYMYINTWI